MSALTSDIFDYPLPRERIAQRPLKPYDLAKLLVLRRGLSTAQPSDAGRFGLSSHTFRDLPELLTPKDLLVFNNSRVLPARLMGTVDNGSTVELMLHRHCELQPEVWQCLGKPLRKCKPGAMLHFAKGLKGQVLRRSSEREVEVSFSWPNPELSFRALLDEVGLVPIPPYIRGGHSDADDKADYQTLFASQDGSIAAPTASLHFTKELMEKLQAKGLTCEFLSLHVGPPSFLALWDAGANVDLSQLRPGVEYYVYDAELLQRLTQWRKHGGRVIAVGTTVVRALESMARQPDPKLARTLQPTELFIKPGFEFKLVDALVTNFHQPRTTHLLLVQALTGAELLSESYQYALSHDFRFLSYGDGMLIL